MTISGYDSPTTPERRSTLRRKVSIARAAGWLWVLGVFIAYLVQFDVYLQPIIGLITRPAGP